MNPIRVLATTFTDILTDLNNDSRTADMPYFWKVAFAGIFAIATIRANILANQVLLSTSEDRTIAEDILAWQDYRLAGDAPAIVSINITVQASATSGGPYTIPTAQLKGKTKGSITSPSIPFEARAPLTIAQGFTTSAFPAWQQDTKTAVNVGKTANVNLQAFDLPDKDVIPETLSVTIGSDTFIAARVFYSLTIDTLAYATPTDPVFIFKQRTDGTCFFYLGFVDADGVQYGKIPAAGLDVIASYAVTQGNAGNVLANTVVQYTGTDANVTAVSNPLAAQGGADQESLSNAQLLAPLRSQTHNMFWDVNSGQAIAQSLPGVLLAKVVMNSLLNSSVYIMPQGGGTASAPLITSVVNQLVSQSYFQQGTVSGFSVAYSFLGISFNVNVKQGVTYANILKFIMLAAAYRASELSFDTFAYYKSFGIVQTIALINTRYLALTGYTYSTDIDLSKVQKIVANVRFNGFGDGLGPDDISTAIEAYVDGVNYVQVTSPMSRILPLASQFIKPTAITVTQI